MKKNVLSKLTAALLASTMMFSAVGCGSTDAGKTSEPTKTSETTVAGQTTETAPEEEKLEYVKLKFVNVGSKPSKGNHEKVWADINEMLLEDLNCEIEVEYTDGWDAKSISLRYAANEKFDMAFSADWMGYMEHAQANSFRAITPEEIHEYMPLVEQYMPERGWEQSKVNGNIYMIPYNGEYCGNMVAFIRGDLREKYGIDPVETKDDFINYLKVIAENEPGMEAYNGHNNRSRLLFVEANHIKNISGATNTFYSLDKAKNGEYVAFGEAFTDEYVEYCKLMNELYKADVWAKDAISGVEGGKILDGLAAACAYNSDTVNSKLKELAESHPDFKMEACNINADAPTILDSLLGNGTVIPRTSENPERVMMVINLFMGDPEYYNLLQYGYEGINYYINDNKERVSLTPAAEDTHDPGPMWGFENAALSLVDASLDPMCREINEQFAANNFDSALAMFSFDKTPVETEHANIKAVYKEYSALNFGMIDDVEGTVEELRKALEAAGYQKYIDEVNRQINDFLNK